jgi:hypothetical protein
LRVGRASQEEENGWSFDGGGEDLTEADGRKGRSELSWAVGCCGVELWMDV